MASAENLRASRMNRTVRQLRRAIASRELPPPAVNAKAWARHKRGKRGHETARFAR